ARHRPDPPTRPQLLRQELVDDLRNPLGRHDPAPQEVAHVRAARLPLPLLPVECQRIEAATLRDPERLVEPCAKLLGLALESIGELLLTPDLARDLAQAALCSRTR